MDKTIEQIIKAFNHIAREFQIYFLSGLVILINILMIDFFYYENSLWFYLKENQILLPSLILVYIIGQLSYAFYYTLLEKTGLDEKIKKFLGFSYSVDDLALPVIYLKDISIFFHFIERYNILTMMRWNLSAAFTINSFVCLYFLLRKEYVWQILLVFTIYLFGALCFYVIALQTESDYSKKINSLKNSNLR